MTLSGDPVARESPQEAACVALIGLPGGGKSTVGRQLAKRLGFEFLDSDHVIEQRLGCSIRTFFDREGEDAFRDIEQAVIAELVGAPRRVLATGGGVVLHAANRQALKQGATVVYLHSMPTELARRLRHDTQRPLLQVADPLAKLRDLYRTRDPLYRETAHFVIETGRPSVISLVNMIAAQLELAGLLPAGHPPA